MALKLLGDIHVQFDRKRAERAIKLLENYVNTNTIVSKEDYIFQLRSQIEVFVNSLARPLADATIIDGRARPTIESMNAVWEDVSEDLIYLYDLYQQLSELIQSGFNYVSGVQNNVRNTISRVGIKAVDASIAFGLPQKAVFVAGDSFQSDALISVDSTVERPFAGSGLTLGRSSTERLGPERFTLRVLYNAIADSGLSFALDPPYEGLLFSPLGQARPEGGIFKFSEKISDAKKTQIKSATAEQTRLRTAPAKGTFGGLINQARAAALEDQKNIRPTDVVLFLAESEETDLIRERLKMFDDDPSTFWEIERSLKLLSSADDSFPDTDTANISRQKIEEFEQDFPNVGLDVILELEFHSFEQLNWINLNPVHFSPRSFVEVTKIEVSEDGEVFGTLPGFDKNRTANILTEQANANLEENQQGVTLEKNKFEFSGQGLWIFPTTRMRFMRIHLKSSASYVTPYDVVAYQMVKRDTTTKKKASFFGIGGGSKTHTSTSTTILRLPYIKGLATFEGQRDLRDLTNQTASSESQGSGFSVNLLGQLDLFSSGGTSTSSTGWYVGQTWQELRTDVFRFALGIRELGLFQNEYVSESQLISETFSVPKPIRTIQVHVDERIPADFPQDQAWIDYFVSIDGGINWVPIGPVGSTLARDNEGARLAQIIQIVSSSVEIEEDPRRTFITPDAEAQEVKLKAVFSRPANQPNSTPALNWYRLVMTTDETFAGLEV